MEPLSIAAVVVVVVIFMCLFPATRKCVRDVAPWALLLGGGLLVGALLASPPAGGQGRYFGAGEPSLPMPGGGADGHGFGGAPKKGLDAYVVDTD
jgi:hypothetical protein